MFFVTYCINIKMLICHLILLLKFKKFNYQKKKFKKFKNKYDTFLDIIASSCLQYNI